MLRKGIWLVIAGLTALILVGPEQTRLPSPGPRVSQQDYSTKCQTPSGICFVEAQPVGSPCTCPNNQNGTIIP